MKVDTIVNCDVLVVGGSGAAVMSAVSAARKGMDVCLASKGKVGKSGNMIMIGGGFGIDGKSAYDICGEMKANQNYTAEMLFETIVKSSFYLADQSIVKQYTEKGPYGVKECLDWARSAKQEFIFIPPASLWNTSGRAFGRAIEQGLRENPHVRVHEDTVVVDLLKNGDVVCGALAVEMYTGAVVEFRAKSVVIATGGFQPFSLKNTISDMTGDGIAMAVRAGASAVDMEFLLFIPTALEPHYIKGSILPYLMTIPNYFPLPPRVTDLDGEPLDIAEAYKKIPPANKMNKILYAYFWGKGAWEKRHKYPPSFYFDYNHYTNEELREGFDKMIAGVARWNAKGHYNGVDLNDMYAFLIKNNKRYMVSLGNEYSMGGIVVDNRLSAGVKGLYAAGEVTGGLFGAFRAADGLTEMLAHGLEAGENAAVYAQNAEIHEADNREALLEKLFAPLKREEGQSPLNVMHQIEVICDEGFNFFRDGEGLERAEKLMSALRDELENMKASPARAYNNEWISAALADNLSLCALMGIRAASMRTESRGTHMRTDYLATDHKNQLSNIVFKLKGEALVWERKVPKAIYLKLPEQDAPTIPDYILSTL